MKRRSFLQMIGMALVAPALPVLATVNCSPIIPAYWGVIGEGIICEDSPYLEIGNEFQGDCARQMDQTIDRLCSEIWRGTT